MTPKHALRHAMLPFQLVLVASMVAPSRANAQSRRQQLAIPAFYGIDQKTNGITYDWLRIQQAADAVKIVVAGDVLAAGVGGTGDASCVGTPRQMFGCLHQTNPQLLVLGYVVTQSGRRDLAGTSSDSTEGANCTSPQGAPPPSLANAQCVLHGGDTGTFRGQPYVDQWLNSYGSLIDGIFLDVGPSDDDLHVAPADQRTYYGNLYRAVSGRTCGAAPGHPCVVMINAAQFPHNWIMTDPIADDFVLWERALHGQDMVSTNTDPANPDRCESHFLPDGTTPRIDPQDYLQDFCPAPGPSNPTNCGTIQDPFGWYFNFANTANVAHIVFSVHSAGDIRPIVTKSQTNYGSPGLLYIHNQDCDATHGARYSGLPDYFEQVVEALRPSSLDVVLKVTNSTTGVTTWLPLSF